ncbi:MAG: hypothetical protein IK058_05290 [Bacteroidales bacterium]|nr:hypothetical protein [Bacteroidales bacterium]
MAVPHKAVQLHLHAVEQRRQLHRHLTPAAPRRRRQLTAEPPLRIGEEVDIVLIATLAARERHRHAASLTVHRAEVHRRQRAARHLQRGIVHRRHLLHHTDTRTVEPDEQVAGAHPLRRRPVGHAHRQRGLQARRQPRQRAEHRPSRLLPCRPRVVHLRRQAPHHGPAVQQIAHHRAHTPDETPQDTIVNLCHNRPFFFVAVTTALK